MSAIDSGARAAEWSAIVLSGGASQRAGGSPKAMLPVGTETALARIVRVTRSAGIRSIAVVTGAHRDALRSRVPEGVAILENPEWSAGRTGSVQVGLVWAEASTGVLVWPVDHPFVDERSVGTLLRAAGSDALALWTMPTFHGRAGHPVAVRAELFPAIRRLAPDEPLRNARPAPGLGTRRLAVDDPGILEGTDERDEYLRGLRAWEGRRWTDD